MVRIGSQCIALRPRELTHRIACPGVRVPVKVTSRLSLPAAATAAVFVALATGFVFDLSVHAADPYTLLAWSEYGMHSIDSDYSVFSLSPPHNILHAQLIDSGGKLVKSDSGIGVTYEAAPDPQSGVSNTTSSGKTNFWQYAGALFGFSGSVDTGLQGSNMPGTGNTPQPMLFDSGQARFSSRGIPLTPNDDSDSKNYYPLMKLVARSSSGAVLATTTIPLPVSDEVTCGACHASGGQDLAMPAAGWVNDPSPDRDFRLNILLRHDDLNLDNQVYLDALSAAGYSSDGLYPTAVSGTPVLCVKCHSSNAPAYPAPGMAGVNPLTAAMHGWHARQADPDTGIQLRWVTDRSACYRCHPGPTTRSLRGAMGHSVASDGSFAIECQSCHGSISDLGGPDRQGWVSLPSCQSCHTGSATTALGGVLRGTSVFDANGNVIAPRILSLPQIRISSTAFPPGMAV
jgi:hypothetical protein